LRNIELAARELKANIKKIIIFKEDGYDWAKIFLKKEHYFHHLC
jgi:hypothetical protein